MRYADKTDYNLSLLNSSNKDDNLVEYEKLEIIIVVLIYPLFLDPVPIAPQNIPPITIYLTIP